PLMGNRRPVEKIGKFWSKPAFATIGLGTGTMASYARPYQHCHYYEIDNNVKRLSLRTAWPANGDYLFFREPADPTRWDSSQAKAPPQFTYLRDALARGAHVQVLMGDARLRMNMPYETKKGSGFYEDPQFGGGAGRVYQLIVVGGVCADA